MILFYFMENVSFLDALSLAKITNHRSGEVKLGEKMLTVASFNNIEEFIKTCDAKFVLIGIPEDIGVKANFGRLGTATAYESTLSALANFQHNKFCKGNNILVLGKLNVDEEMKVAQNLNPKNKEERKQLFKLVEKIDIEVSHLIHKIISLNKIPIVIGGGHNNAYGLIKGLALAKGKAVNAINFDAHTDFRMLEGRHSGNGFSYAFEDGFLKKYFIFGLHESFVSKSVFNEVKAKHQQIKYCTYEEIDVRKEKNFDTELKQALEFIKQDYFGIELDVDALPNIVSSAMTLSGFSLDKARQYIHFMAKSEMASYLHICEGAPSLDQSLNQHLTGKLIATLITDFIKSKLLE